MLAMVVNDDAGYLMPRVALASIASMLAPTAPSPSTAIKKVHAVFNRRSRLAGDGARPADENCHLMDRYRQQAGSYGISSKSCRFSHRVMCCSS